MPTIETADPGIDLAQYIRRIWRGRIAIGYCVALSFLLSLIYLHVSTKLYTATMTVVAAHNYGNSDRANASLGSLASLAGVRLGQASTGSPFDNYMMAINTPETAGLMLAHKRDIAARVFPKDWDEKSGSWQERQTALGGILRQTKWMLLGTNPSWSPPDAAAMQRFIKNHVDIDRDKDTGAVTLSFSDADRGFATYFLAVLNKTVDDEIRERARVESSTYIDYISLQLRTITVSEQRDALASLLSDAEKKAILAGSRLPYAADVFSAPYSPPVPSKPIPLLVIALAIFAGVAAGSVYALLRDRISPVLNLQRLKSLSWLHIGHVHENIR